MSLFEKVALVPPDPILGLTAAYLHDKREKKVNLGVGYYKDDKLQTPILKCVKEAEEFLLESEGNKEYQPIEGHKAMIEKLGELVFGETFWKKQRNRIAGFQTVGGTGALKIAGTFCNEEMNHPILLPTPTWPNHHGVFARCPMQIHNYPYYDLKSHKLEIDKMREFFEEQKQRNIILLHASCHNPTGCDPTLTQWEELSHLIGKKDLIPFFDFAYQGLGEGVSEDAKAVRFFAETGCEMFVAFSAAKNFSLYGERVGALFILADNSKPIDSVQSCIRQIIRTNYSNPPKHGAAVVAHILCNDALKEQWVEELKAMRIRIKEIKEQLAQQLISSSKTHDFHHVKEGHGMFCFTGLKEEQVDRLVKDYAIYMPRDGRINVCGLNANNIDYVVNAIISVGSLN